MIARRVLSLLITVTSARAANFYCDPIHGSPQGDGSSARPWQTIESVLQARRIQLRDRAGNPANPDAPVKPGDTVLLRSGWHGVNTVSNNFAHSFDFKADGSVKTENNQQVTESVFNQRLVELAREIDQRFGERHPTAKRPRL